MLTLLKDVYTTIPKKMPASEWARDLPELVKCSWVPASTVLYIHWHFIPFQTCSQPLVHEKQNILFSHSNVISKLIDPMVFFCAIKFKLSMKM